MIMKDMQHLTTMFQLFAIIPASFEIKWKALNYVVKSK